MCQTMKLTSLKGERKGSMYNLLGQVEESMHKGSPKLQPNSSKGSLSVSVSVWSIRV